LRDIVWGLILFASTHVRSFRAYVVRSYVSYLYTVRARHGSECCVYHTDTPNSEKGIAALMLLLLSAKQGLTKNKTPINIHSLCMYYLMQPAPSNCFETKSMPIQWPCRLIRCSGYHMSYHSASFLFPSTLRCLRYFITYSYVSRVVVAAGTARIMLVPIPA